MDANIKKISSYVNNPCLLNQVQKDVEECASQIKISDFNNNKILKNGFIYTTCIFCFFKKNQLQCKNMKEGRFGKCVLRDGTTITYCYPELKNVKHRIQIGIHLDLMIGANGDVSHSYLGNIKKKSWKEKVEEKKVEEKKVEEKKVEEKKVEKEKVEKEKVEEKSGILNEFYKDLYEKLYEEMYKKRVIEKEELGSSQLLLENISLKSHIEYLHMKMNTLLKGEYNTMDEEINKNFYEKMYATHFA
jgi:hypothetical protein